MTEKEFRATFASLTGNPPLSWQWRLFRDYFAKNDLSSCSVIDLPTGLGKTMVIAIWLIAWSCNSLLPRRLVYVVDRRTVVDQATTLAIKLQRRIRALHRLARRRPELRPLCESFPIPAISTLRGQLADNREWSRDLSRPAIIIGTVDLIGSALLFSGYRAGYKRRPLEAGLLGQDSLLVLDEAHLSRPFEKLLGAIVQFNKACINHIAAVKPMRVIRMSATTSIDSTSDVFRLEGDLERRTGDFGDDAVRDRYTARKNMTVRPPLGEKDRLTDKLAGEAIKLAESNLLSGKRIVVFVRKPDDARAVATAIRQHVAVSVGEPNSNPNKTKTAPYVNSVKVLTGAMRGLERDELVKKAIFQERWLKGNLKADDPTNQAPVFLVATSAGEVGFDLNADHMVCDATTIDSLVQRLGRVNRRGLGDATVIVVPEPLKTKKGKPVELSGVSRAIANTLELINDVHDASPQNIGSLKAGIWKERYADACSPDVSTVELTDVLLDAWSMTSITDRMPGRPEVEPWLRGIDEELPQTTIAWRAELDEPGFADLALDDIEEWLDTHRILTHETLSVPTSAAAKWFTDRWNRLDDKQKQIIGTRSIIIDRAGLKLATVTEVINQLGRKTTEPIRNTNLILPASFGGIERGVGLLDPETPRKLAHNQDADDETEKNADTYLAAPDIADVASGYRRLREIITKTEDGETENKAIGGGEKPPKPLRFRLDLESDDDKSVRLVSYVPRREKLEVGSAKQTLKQHVDAVESQAKRIANDLQLKPGDPIREALLLAAHYHDHGKNRERWQNTVNGTATIGTTDWMQQTTLEGDGEDQCIGKSGGEMKRDPRGYRHEFGSLCEFTDAFKAGKLLDHSGKPINQDGFDIAMHLIATHHGRGRPHFCKGGFDPDSESQSDAIHTESIRRFARLQRKYGWWHLAWLENLLRCADALASADPDAERDHAGSEGGAA